MVLCGLEGISSQLSYGCTLPYLDILGNCSRLVSL